MAVDQSSRSIFLSHVTFVARPRRKMADEERQAKERSRSAQPSEDSDNEGDVDRAAKRQDAKVTSKLYATLLVLLGIILYVYVLYIVLANLLYPCSLAPFLATHNTSASTRNTLRARLGE